MNYGNPPPAMNPPPGYGPQPYAPPPKKGMSTGKILLIVFGSIGGLALLCCGGCVGIMFVGFGEMETQLKSQYGNDPVVQEHLGGFTEVDYSFKGSIDESQGGTQNMVFDVKGPKGSGRILAVQSAGGTGFSSAVLRINGTDYDLGVVDTDFSDEFD